MFEETTMKNIFLILLFAIFFQRKKDSSEMESPSGLINFHINH